MASRTDIAIIGAGPYGLSIGAHLNKGGIDLRAFGVPMQAWSAHMPQGMLLKSAPACSNLSDPAGELPLGTFCGDNGIPYEDHDRPVRRDDFVRYGLEFQRRFVPQIEPRTVVRLESVAGGYQLHFDRGEDVVAHRVVVASGYLPFRYMPAALRDLPPELASHSSDYGTLEGLRNKRVVILGAGWSALDLAGLLSHQGSRVTLIARAPQLQGLSPQAISGSATPSPRTLRRRASGASADLGEGWLMRLCADAPQLIHHLPDSLRLAILEGSRNPPGSAQLNVPLYDTVSIKLSRPVVRAQERGGALQLTIVASDGSCELLDCDHIIAATGYRLDLRKLEFLSEALLANLSMLDYSPVLSANFESSAPGLYFAGLAAARTFGPALRFVQGTVHAARRIAEHVSPSSSRGRPLVGRSSERQRHNAA